MSVRSLRTVLIALAVLVSAACSGTAGEEGEGSAGGTSTQASAQPGRPAPTTLETATGPVSGNQTTTSTTESAEDFNASVGRGSLSVSVRFDRPCVRRGETQTITIDVGTPGTAAYNTVYADGKNVYDKDFPGGNTGGNTDAAGRYQDVWTIGPAAAPGPAQVVAVGMARDGNRGRADGTFQVAGSNGRCE